MLEKLTVIGERFEGQEGQEYDAKLVNIRKADNHRGLLILDFATSSGPLPLYCYGDLVSDGAIIRSNMLVGLEMTAGDIGRNSFIVTAGRRKRKDGTFGNPCVVGISRKAFGKPEVIPATVVTVEPPKVKKVTKKK